ncbi:MAG: hypothetical protein KKF44_09960 [Nanoarchaeota archaeon]|nr:hypothetical protein [Nanoarchaeota archaeon]
MATTKTDKSLSTASDEYHNLHNCVICGYKVSCRHLNPSQILSSLDYHNPKQVSALDGKLYDFVIDPRDLATDEVELIELLSPDQKRFRKIIRLDKGTVQKAENLIISCFSDGFYRIVINARSKKCEELLGMSKSVFRKQGPEGFKHTLKELIEDMEEYGFYGEEVL